MLNSWLASFDIKPSLPWTLKVIFTFEVVGILRMLMFTATKPSALLTFMLVMSIFMSGSPEQMEQSNNNPL